MGSPTFCCGVAAMLRQLRGGATDVGGPTLTGVVEGTGSHPFTSHKQLVVTAASWSGRVRSLRAWALIVTSRVASHGFLIPPHFRSLNGNVEMTFSQNPCEGHKSTRATTSPDVPDTSSIHGSVFGISIAYKRTWNSAPYKVPSTLSFPRGCDAHAPQSSQLLLGDGGEPLCGNCCSILTASG